jgi:hypothetical protein
MTGMARILRSDQISPQTVTAIGIAVHRKGLHIGVLYRVTDSATVRILHLAWHHALRSEELKADYACWIRPDILDDRAMAIASFCRRIWKQNQRNQVPYGFSRPNDFFDTSGNLIKGPARIGLTCASFVLAVFAAAAFPLADLATWPVPTAVDIERQHELLQKLDEDPCVNKDHVQAAKAEIGNTRYRPLDVAGAGAASEFPAPYSLASKAALEINTLLESI